MKAGDACEVLRWGQWEAGIFQSWDVGGMVASVMVGQSLRLVGRNGIRIAGSPQSKREKDAKPMITLQDCPECGGNPCPMPCQTCRGTGRVEVESVDPFERREFERVRLATTRPDRNFRLAFDGPAEVPPLDPEPGCPLLYVPSPAPDEKTERLIAERRAISFDEMRTADAMPKAKP